MGVLHSLNFCERQDLPLTYTTLSRKNPQLTSLYVAENDRVMWGCKRFRWGWGEKGMRNWESKTLKDVHDIGR